MNHEQVRDLLKHIDATQNETVKSNIFAQLGYGCFHTRQLKQWIDGFDGDVELFLDNINVEHKSRYWESLIFSSDKKQLILTGKEVDGCACAFADCDDPPLSLCNYCCKNFQQELFKYLLHKPVDVTITASYLRGDRRCNTIIEIR